MRVFVVTPPEPALSLDEVKAHLRVRHDDEDEDEVIRGYIAAAQGHIDGPDGWLGRAVGVQTLEARLPEFESAISLPFRPVIDIVSLKYLDSTAVEATLPAAAYEVSGSTIRLAYGSAWPKAVVHPEAVRIQYRAGYAALPPAMRTALLLMTGDLYANRETTAYGTSGAEISMSVSVRSLLSPFRVFT